MQKFPIGPIWTIGKVLGNKSKSRFLRYICIEMYRETMKRIEVVAAVIRRDGKYFATQRGYGKLNPNRSLIAHYEFTFDCVFLWVLWLSSVLS